MYSEIDLMIRITVATILGGIVGIDRERGAHPAGFRTHILVCVGACLITIVSIYGFSDFNQRDPARLAAQIVSGIGFLGAGTILHKGISVRGLTTAASMWIVAGIGIATGAGMLAIATFTTFLVRVVLASYLFMSYLFKSKQSGVLQICINKSEWELGAFNRLFEGLNVTINSFDIIFSDDSSLIIELSISAKQTDVFRVISAIKDIHFVTSVTRVD